MTYLIALCDDEAAELDKTEKLLEAYEEKHPEMNFMIRRFESAEELLYMVEERNYAPDLIFLDIFMPGGGGEQASVGMAMARKLRAIESKARILFLTTSREYALEAFDVDAWQYLVKPLTKEKLFAAMDKFQETEEAERKRYVLFKIEGRFEKMPVGDIVLCEAQRKTQCLHLANGGQRVLHMTMGEIYELLSPFPEFLRIGAGYIVNLEYVESLSTQDICLRNGRSIFLPRGKYKEIKELYFQYFCGGGVEIY